MADSFSIHHITHYLQQMGIKIAHQDYTRAIIELAFHRNHILTEVTRLLEQHTE